MKSYEIIGSLGPAQTKLVAGWAAARRRDAEFLLKAWTEDEGFEELIDYVCAGGEVQEYCDAKALRVGKVLRWIKADPARVAEYGEALVISADRIMNETVKIADDVLLEQLAMNKATMRIQAKSRLAKTRAVGYTTTVRSEISGAGGAALPPIYVQYIPSGAGTRADDSDSDPI